MKTVQRTTKTHAAVMKRIGKSWQSLFIIGKGETIAEPEGEILILDEGAAYLKAGNTERAASKASNKGDRNKCLD